MKEQLPSIFGYTNYRQYLADFYQARKNSARGYSHRQFAAKAGFNSPNALRNVMDGSRNLTPQSAEQFISAIGLEGKAADYFRNLVLMNQAELDADKEKFFQKLKSLTPISRRYELQSDAMDYIQHWISPVIRELIPSKGFRDDPYWIQRRLTGNADLKDIVNALNFLKKNGFIVKDDKGTFAVKDDVIISSDEVRSMAIRGYYRRVIEQAIRMMDDVPVQEREYGALIFNIGDEFVPELKEKMKEFRRELHKWSLPRARPDGRVVQVLLQMYPQTRSEGQTENKD